MNQFISQRLLKFRGFANHAIHGKVVKKLSREEHDACLAFITQHEALTKGEFEHAVNRWMLDQPKPKRWSAMWSLVSMSNA